jgi:hypothetical protein
MSVITDVVIIASDGEDEALAYLNEWLAENDSRKQQLREISLGEGGGSKATSATTYAACFNHLDLGGLEEAITRAPWKLPGSVVAYFDYEMGSPYVISPKRSGERWETEPDFSYY